MTRDELHKLMERVLTLLKNEQRLKVELASLNLGLGRPAVLKRNLQRQNEILAEINAIRLGQIMPIMRDLAALVKLAHEQRLAVTGRS